MGVQVEVSTEGIDDAVQGLSSDPFGAPIANTLGLRIPFFRQDNTTRYLFLLATRVVTKPTRIVGLRQYLTIGAQADLGSADSGTVQVQPIEFQVQTPNFSFMDGNVSWHLVEEPNIWPVTTPIIVPGLVDSTCFVQGNADAPALLYAPGSVGWAEAQPIYYFNTMTSYAPPPVWEEWQPIAGLGNMHDLRFPWNSNWGTIDASVNTSSARRISLYASVLQTAGATPISSNPGFVAGTSGFGPEQDFINAIATLDSGEEGGDATSVFFYRVAGSIMFEDISEKEAFDG